MRRYSLVILFILLFFAATSCKKTGQREKEPNNDFFSYNRITADSIMEGRLDTSQDHDIYRIGIIDPVIMDI